MTQSWYLTDDTAGVPPPITYFMDKGSGAGTSALPIGPSGYLFLDWAAKEPAAETCDMSGTWKTHIEFSGITGEERVKVIAGLGVLSGDTPAGVGQSDKILTSRDNIFDVDITTSDHEIGPGEYLVFAVVCLNDGSGNEEIVVTGSESYISSPGTDPGYTVLELSSLVLFSIGLLAFAGYVWVRRRK